MKIRLERDGPVATVVVDRPEVRNALDREAITALAAALREIEEDETIGAGVVWGAGGAFCSGADLKELGAGVDYIPWAGDGDGPLAARLSKPMIAAVAGYACAGGLGLALWCDMRVAERSAQFAVLSRRWGVPMSDGTTVRLPRLIGEGRALDMLLTARKVDAQEALAIGLANRVVPDGRARAAAETLAAEIAAFPPIAMRSDRASALGQTGLEEAEALRRELVHAEAARRIEAQSGARRFADGAGRHGETG